jgi:glycosyltransferase involved in cell wall biosynthesis
VGVGVGVRRPPSVLFVGLAYAGHRTRFENLRRHTQLDARIRPTYREVTGWVEGGWIERLPGVPTGARGRLRAVAQAAPIASWPRPDVIWTSVAEAGVPHLWSQLGRLRRPLVHDLDATLDQMESFASRYFDRPPRRGARRVVSQVIERVLWRTTSLFTPWSQWAADGLRRAGIADARIAVLPPGVDLDQWRPRPELRAEDQPGGPLRLLFVGGDFARKGGPLLVDLVGSRFAGRCELDVVTRDPVRAAPGVRVHRAEANSPRLRELYARADLFVLPTQAECFGIATVEALASGLPVVVSDLGGARDLVQPGATGWLVEPSPEALVDALEEALARRAQLGAMGRQARAVAEARFDGRRNDARVVELLLEQAARHRARD